MHIFSLIEKKRESLKYERKFNLKFIRYEKILKFCRIKARCMREMMGKECEQALLDL